jgi:hypothetical protein
MFMVKRRGFPRVSFISELLHIFFSSLCEKLIVVFSFYNSESVRRGHIMQRF